MDIAVFNYQLGVDTVVFSDTIFKNSPYISFKPRDHESIFIVTKGSLLYEKDSFKEIVSEGQIGYIAKGSIDKSSAYNCDGVSYIAINFSFNGSSNTLPFKTLCEKGNFAGYENLFLQALNCFALKSNMCLCNSFVLQIIGLLYSEHVGQYKDNKKIKNAMEYLKSNFNNPDLKISYLAELCHISEKQFRRIFLKLYNKTPFLFLQEFRINKAEILLKNTQKSISEIAIQCGFSDVYSFSHSFKKHKGISPHNYRK